MMSGIARQPELPIDPPAEPENDPELTELMENAHEHRQRFQSIGIELAEANLLNEEEDHEWEYAFECFELLLGAAAGRVAEVSRRRRDEPDDD